MRKDEQQRLFSEYASPPKVAYMLQWSEPTKFWALGGLVATFTTIWAPLFGNIKHVAASWWSQNLEKIQTCGRWEMIQDGVVEIWT